jgi:arsenate reductase (thioredoxin)
MSEPQVHTVTNVLFLCVGNSCRSQMAEAFANRLGEGKLRAWSAGSHPLGWITPDTRTVMDEKGIALAAQWSKGVDDVPMDQMEVVVTMGCEVDCPLPAEFKGRVLEWNIADPFGSDLGRYRAARDSIEAQVRELLAGIETGA